MTARGAIALTVLLATSGVITGCGAGADPGAPVTTALTCGTVVDPTGHEGRPLTVGLAVALLARTQLAGGAASILKGTPNSAEAGTLDIMAIELMGYSGSRLSDDAQAFAVTELNYAPHGQVEVAYAIPLDDEIRALERDCPDGAKLARRQLTGQHRS